MASVWAIGDIHGEIDKLQILLDAIPRRPEDTLVFLGDYIDRGPDSAAVVRRVLQEHDDAAPDKVILLWGNHEDMAAEHFGFAAPSRFRYEPQDWFRNGGTACVRSFGIRHNELYTAECPGALARLLALLRRYWIPPRSLYPELASYVFVHAGLMPDQDPETTPGSTLLWVRDEFLNAPDHSGRIVVHGHSPHKSVRVFPGKIGIDTGAAYGGLLTALSLPERKLVQVDGNGAVLLSELESSE